VTETIIIQIQQIQEATLIEVVRDVPDNISALLAVIFQNEPDPYGIEFTEIAQRQFDIVDGEFHSRFVTVALLRMGDPLRGSVKPQDRPTR